MFLKNKKHKYNLSIIIFVALFLFPQFVFSSFLINCDHVSNRVVSNGKTYVYTNLDCDELRNYFAATGYYSDYIKDMSSLVTTGCWDLHINNGPMSDWPTEEQIGACTYNCCFSETPQTPDQVISPGQLPVAQTIDQSPPPKLPLTFKPEIGFPGFDKEIKISGFLLGNFLAAFFKYLVYLSGVVAVIILVIAGFQWVLAGGNPNQISGAKQRLTNGIIGLVLCSCSYLILYTINPELLNIREIGVEDIDPEDFDGDTPDTFSLGGAGGVIQYEMGYPYQCPSHTVVGMYNALNNNTSYIMGAKYTWRGNSSPNIKCGKTYCLDCSGLADFVRYCVGLSPLNEIGGTRGIFQNGILIKSGDTAYSLGLRPGDLVGWKGEPVGHVLIYLGNNQLFDSHGVKKSNNPRTIDSIDIHDFDKYVSKNIGRIKYRKR